MSNGKHSYNRKSKNKDSIEKEKSGNKRILTIVLLSIFLIVAILVSIFFIYKYYLKDILVNSNNTLDQENLGSYYEPTKKANTEESLTVTGAEYLEITGLYLNTDNPNISTVAAKLKNTTNISYDNVSLRITLLDKDDNVITSLDYKINNIEANGEASTFAAVKQDLSNCVNYSISLEKK